MLKQLIEQLEQVDYLDLCEEEGIKPEIAYKGSLNIRFRNADIHRQAAVYAITHNQSLNSFIEEAVEEKLAVIKAQTLR